MKFTLDMFEELFSKIFDFVLAIVEKEFPEIAKVLGKDEATNEVK